MCCAMSQYIERCFLYNKKIKKTKKLVDQMGPKLQFE